MNILALLVFVLIATLAAGFAAAPLFRRTGGTRNVAVAAIVAIAVAGIGLATYFAVGRNPDDFGGWMRLIRAYAVMGEPDKARSALARARSQFARDANAQKSLTALAGDLHLQTN